LNSQLVSKKGAPHDRESSEFIKFITLPPLDAGQLQMLKLLLEGMQSPLPSIGPEFIALRCITGAARSPS
jgi:hypothetical protein